MVSITLTLLYTLIIASLIWARFNFFVSKSKSGTFVSFINDPMVFVQIIVTYFYLYNQELTAYQFWGALTGYGSGFLLFWWSIRTSKSLSFASEDLKNEVYTNGPYSIARHPFYLSYILFWSTNAILFQSSFLWISFAVLIGVYVDSAIKEEKKILRGIKSEEYRNYKKRVGMFFPKPSIFLKIEFKNSNRKT